jgi:hypothetical protein
LRHDQQLSQREQAGEPAPVTTGGNVLVLQHRHDVGTRRLQRRREAEQQPGRDREQRREREHPRIDRQLFVHRDR